MNSNQNVLNDIDAASLPSVGTYDLSTWPMDGQPFDQLRDQEDELLNQGIRVRLFSFSSPRGITTAVVKYKVGKTPPTLEVISQMFNRTLQAGESSKGYQGPLQ